MWVVRGCLGAGQRADPGVFVRAAAKSALFLSPLKRTSAARWPSVGLPVAVWCGVDRVPALVGAQLAGVLVQEVGDSEQVAAYLLPFLPYLFAVIAAGGAEAALVAADREHYLAWLQLGASGGLLAGTWLGLSWGWTPAQVLLLFSGVGMVRLLAACGLVRQALGGGSWWRWQGLGELVRYARPVGLNDAMGTLSRYVDRFVVLHFFAGRHFCRIPFRGH